MRIVAELPHSEMKITVFQWEGKYTIQWETPHAQSALKISDEQITLDQIKENIAQYSESIIPAMNTLQKTKADIVFKEKEDVEFPVII